MNRLANKWMDEQTRMARSLYLIFDAEGEGETRQALLTQNPPAEYVNVYGKTALSHMTNGPLIFHINGSIKPLLRTLLETPERSWGWLFSCKGDPLMAIAEHWRARILIGQRPEQSLYRFHDNRVLTRALRHLEPEQLPDYLGPVCSLLYWNGQEWATAENPAPGLYPVPEDPAWLSVPVPPEQSRAILHANTCRMLIEDCFEEMSELAETTNTHHWVTAQLDLADAWGWTTTEHITFLMTQSLKEVKGQILQSWLPRPGETPDVHLERLVKEARYWAEGS